MGGSTLELGAVLSPSLFSQLPFLTVWGSWVSLQAGAAVPRLCLVPCQLLLLSQPCCSLSCPALCSCFHPKQLP